MTDSGVPRPRPPRRGRHFATCAEARQHGARILGGVGLLVGAVASLSPRVHGRGQGLAVIGGATVGGGLLGYWLAGRDPACTGEDET